MHIDEFRSQFGVSRSVVYNAVKRGYIPPPHPHADPTQRWDISHVAEMRAYLALRDNNTVFGQVLTLLREDGITLADYLRRREDGIKQHGLSPVYG